MILLDNCVPRRYLRLLGNWGYDAALMTDHIPADAPDPDVIALAGQLGAVLLTVDLDFANILDLYFPLTGENRARLTRAAKQAQHVGQRVV